MISVFCRWLDVICYSVATLCFGTCCVLGYAPLGLWLTGTVALHAGMLVTVLCRPATPSPYDDPKRDARLEAMKSQARK